VDPEPLVDRLHRIEAIELRAAALGERPVPEGEGSLDAVNAEVATAQADLERAVGALRELEVAARFADQNIDQIVAGLAETEHLRRRYREVALFEAAEIALNSTIGSVLGEAARPLPFATDTRGAVTPKSAAIPVAFPSPGSCLPRIPSPIPPRRPGFPARWPPSNSHTDMLGPSLTVRG